MTDPTRQIGRAARDTIARIGRACRESLTELDLPPDPTLLVGVSGGADSSALILALADRAEREGWALVAAHVDHQIALPSQRAEFQAAASAVADRAGVPIYVRSVDVPGEAARAGDGLEAAARRLRYQALCDVAEAVGVAAVVVGHTMDDQAESVLLHLLRGSGLDGLAGMLASGTVPLPGARLPLLRPLLSLRRSDTTALCAALGTTPVEDPSNRDRTYTRSRIRAEIVPHLAAINPAIVERLASLAASVSLDRALLDHLGAAALDEARDDERGGLPLPNELHLSRRRVQAQPRALQARLLRRAIVGLGADPPDWERTQALLRLVERGGHRVQYGGGVTAIASGDRLCLRRALPG